MLRLDVSDRSGQGCIFIGIGGNGDLGCEPNGLDILTGRGEPASYGQSQRAAITQTVDDLHEAFPERLLTHQGGAAIGLQGPRHDLRSASAPLVYQYGDWARHRWIRPLAANLFPIPVAPLFV